MPDALTAIQLKALSTEGKFDVLWKCESVWSNYIGWLWLVTFHAILTASLFISLYAVNPVLSAEQLDRL